MSPEDKKVELQIKELELRNTSLEQQIEAQKKEAQKSNFLKKFNPVLATILVALIGFLGTTVATIINNSNTNALEQKKYEYELIKKGLEQPTEKERIKFLKTLTSLKLIDNKHMAAALDSLVKNPKSIPYVSPFSVYEPGRDTLSRYTVESISLEQLKMIMPKADESRLTALKDEFNKHLSLNFSEGEPNLISKVGTPERIAAFVATIAFETKELKTFEENFNYSANALIKLFSKYFASREEAERYAQQPEKIANRLYANKLENGDEASGDGWRYRGRGIFQITGKQNYKYLSQLTGYDLVSNPDLLDDFDIDFAVAGIFWRERGLNLLADSQDIVTLTKKMNGTTNGLEMRKEYYNKAKKAFNVED